jgi:membrane-bound lytic murein transglycosylase D
MRNLIVAALLGILSGCAVQPENSTPAYTVLGDAPFPALLKNPLAVSQMPNEIEPAPQPPDVWNRIRAGFVLPDIDHPRIQQQLDWYARHPGYMQRVAERARPYMHFIIENIEKNDLPSEIALLPIVESAFQPFAYSHGRASGIWQFIPSTGRRFGLKQNWWYDGRRDIYASTQAAIELLDRLQSYFDGDWMLALAAYNSGSGNVRRAIRRNQRHHRPTDFFSLDLPRETRAYVPKLLALKKIVADPQAYGITLDPIPDRPYFTKVELDGQIDLAKAAELADMELDDLYELNPGFNRWATSPNGPHYLLIPKDKAEQFEARLDQFPDKQMITWVRYRIRQGDTLSTIASKYNTSIHTIKRVNHLRGTMLRVGHSLTIPVASQRASEYRLSKAQRTKALQNRPRRGTKITYIVQQGDTFWELAQRHGVSVRALAKWNGMAPRDPLIPGQKLVIWSRSTSRVSYLNTGYITAPPRRSVTKRIGYRVRRGDSLARISQKFNVSIHQLRKWNGLPKGRYLQPGQRLTLYVDVMQTSS